MFTKKAIGIDLGTSTCCVGIFRDGKVEILENEQGNKTTPSYVVFTDTERRVGENAKNYSTLNPANTVFSVKRIIGREWEDGLVTAAVNKMPYTIKTNDKKETCIQVSYKKMNDLLVPQQITAMLLGQMKDLAEQHLKESVDEAVISVPASFSNAQRQATKEAAAIAGLSVLALINEPTAAAIAYEANRRKTDEENVAVIDFGAGYLDVAIVTVCSNRVSVRAVSGSTDIGGNDIDEILMECVRRKFQDIYGQKPESPATTERLRSSCEKLKRKLSMLTKVHDTLDCFGDDTVLTVDITRDDLKLILPPRMQSSLNNILRQVMCESRMHQEDISRVVLVGGSSRFPLFQTWIQNFFGQIIFDKHVNPDESVAYGATLYAALLSKDYELGEFKLDDAFSHNYYLSSEGDQSMHLVFDQCSSKNLPQQRMYPFEESSPFNEKNRKQTFKLYEGLFDQNNPHRLIGTLCLDEEFGRATPHIDNVTFEIDRCGIFNAVVQIKPPPIFRDLLTNHTGMLNENALQKFIKREGEWKKSDQDERERAEALSNLEALSYRLSARNYGMAEKFFPEIVKEMKCRADENLKWLDDYNTLPKAECVKRHNELNKLEIDLDCKIKLYEKDEEDRWAAETKLKSYCSSLEKLMNTGMDTDLKASLSKLLKETTKWLETSERPSKNDCEDRTVSMEKVHLEVERRQEEDRLAAVNNLQEYCSKLKNTEFVGKEFDFIRSDVKRLTEENERCMHFINEKFYHSKSQCDVDRDGLEKMVRDIKNKLKLRRARQWESERPNEISKLRSRCIVLKDLALQFSESDTEGYKIVANVILELDRTQQWLSLPENITREEYDNTLQMIENNMKTLNVIKEKDRLACLERCRGCVATVEQTLSTKSFPKKERKLVDNMIQSRDRLRSILMPNRFVSEDFESELVTFNQAVETWNNRLKINKTKSFKL